MAGIIQRGKKLYAAYRAGNQDGAHRSAPTHPRCGHHHFASN